MAAKKKRQFLDWEEWYLLAARYRDDHGDLLVPKDYVCEGGERLGRWIERQRAKYNRVPSMKSPIEPWQIEYLDRLGMVWKLKELSEWERWMEALDGYAARHGNIDVPRACEFAGLRLGDWLNKQRLYYAYGQLNPEEIGDLERRGVNWSLRPRRQAWEDWFAEAEAYYRAHGDLMVKLDYLTPRGGKLGFWIYKQRDIYMGRKKSPSLTPERIEMLNGIGMVWDPLAGRSDAWERMVRYIEDYKNQNGRLPLWPRELKAPDGRSYNGWIRMQRQLLAEGSVPPEKAETLAGLGITPARRTPRRQQAEAQA